MNPSCWGFVHGKCVTCHHRRGQREAILPATPGPTSSVLEEGDSPTLRGSGSFTDAYITPDERETRKHNIRTMTCMVPSLITLWCSSTAVAVGFTDPTAARTPRGRCTLVRGMYQSPAARATPDHGGLLLGLRHGHPYELRRHTRTPRWTTEAKPPVLARTMADECDLIRSGRPKARCHSAAPPHSFINRDEVDAIPPPWLTSCAAETPPRDASTIKTVPRANH
jgi:hypothetical protein